jgi:hypothetical protein
MTRHRNRPGGLVRNLGGPKGKSFLQGGSAGGRWELENKLLELEPIMRPRFVTPCAIGAILFALTWTPSASQASTLRAPGGGTVRALVIGIDRRTVTDPFLKGDESMRYKRSIWLMKDYASAIASGGNR